MLEKMVANKQEQVKNNLQKYSEGKYEPPKLDLDIFLLSPKIVLHESLLSKNIIDHED